jgi:hypothetical protein
MPPLFQSDPTLTSRGLAWVFHYQAHSLLGLRLKDGTESVSERLYQRMFIVTFRISISRPETRLENFLPCSYLMHSFL